MSRTRGWFWRTRDHATRPNLAQKGARPGSMLNLHEYITQRFLIGMFNFHGVKSIKLGYLQPSCPPTPPCYFYHPTRNPYEIPTPPLACLANHINNLEAEQSPSQRIRSRLQGFSRIPHLFIPAEKCVGSRSRSISYTMVRLSYQSRD